MKNIYKFLILTLAVASFTACEDIDKNPYELSGVDGPFGTFVRLDFTTPAVLDVTDIDNTTFGGRLTNPSGNVASYELKVRRVSNGTASDYQTAFSTTSFPAEVIVTPASLASLFGLTATELIPGDRFDFEATSIGTSGEVVTFDDFAPNLAGNPAEAQGYRFVTFLSCPFIQADALGTYAITASNGSWQGTNTTFEVIAGPGGNITMVDPIGHLLPGDPPDKYNVAITVTPGSGQAAIGSQLAWDSSHPVFGGTPYGPGNVNGSGFVFSCAGSIVLNLTYTVAAGSFGSAPFGGQKI